MIRSAGNPEIYTTFFSTECCCTPVGTEGNWDPIELIFDSWVGRKLCASRYRTSMCAT